MKKSTFHAISEEDMQKLREHRMKLAQCLADLSNDDITVAQAKAIPKEANTFLRNLKKPRLKDTG